MEARSQLELVFHQFLSSKAERKLTIYLNNVELEGYDPFLLSHPATQTSHTEKVETQFGDIEFTPYVLPHFSKLDPQNYKAIEGNEGLVRNRFYVYRNKRLIIHGTWFGIFKYGELSDLVRVKVDIPNTMDHLWQISIDKKDAKLPQNLKIRLKKQLAKIHVKSKKVYRRRSTPLTIGDETGAWTKSKKSGRTKFEINRESALVKSLISTLENDQVKASNIFSNTLNKCYP